jgi:DNA-binding response OmpR family regulator
MVEDSEDHAALIRMLVSSLHPEFDLHWEQSIGGASYWLKSDRPDVILLDLNLPDLEGSASLRAIRTIAPGVPVVVLTADGRRASHVAGLRGGAKYFLVKDATEATEICACLRNAAGERLDVIEVDGIEARSLDEVRPN